ncbi:DNA methyltransferase [candidate division KSB1 bacterium]|nr:DNA methyltransferase [candidate division KSB1 bacterium]
MNQPFTCTVIDLVKKIPPGKVSTYGCIAARQVVRILHSSSEKHELPWHRVVNRQGKIALRSCRGYEIQKMLLEKEGIQFDPQDRIDLDRFLWNPASLAHQKE